MTRVGVMVFPGSCDDRDALRAVELLGAEAVRIWHRDEDLGGADAVIVPAGSRSATTCAAARWQPSRRRWRRCAHMQRQAGRCSACATGSRC